MQCQIEVDLIHPNTAGTKGSNAREAGPHSPQNYNNQSPENPKTAAATPQTNATEDSKKVAPEDSADADQLLQAKRLRFVKKGYFSLKFP